MKKIISIAILFFTQVGSGQNDSLYFSQPIPGDNPEIFALGTISLDGRYEHDICFSPDGLEVFFSVSEANWEDFIILTSKWIDGNWSIPDTADFSREYKNTEIVYSPDGQSLLFASSSPAGAFNVIKLRD